MSAKGGKKLKSDPVAFLTGAAVALVAGAGIQTIASTQDPIPPGSRSDPWLKDVRQVGGRVFLENLDHPMSAMWVYPHDTVGIGPISALREELTRRQSQSLESKAGPYLVRFGIVDCWGGSGPHLPDPARPETATYGVKAILYWAYVKPDSTPARAVRMLRTGGLTGVHAGASLAMVVLETRKFKAVPNNIQTTDYGYEIGGTGWAIADDSVRVSTETRMVREHNNAVAFYDISLTAFR